MFIRKLTFLQSYKLGFCHQSVNWQLHSKQKLLHHNIMRFVPGNCHLTGQTCQEKVMKVIIFSLRAIVFFQNKKLQFLINISIETFLPANGISMTDFSITVLALERSRTSKTRNCKMFCLFLKVEQVHFQNCWSICSFRVESRLFVIMTQNSIV